MTKKLEPLVSISQIQLITGCNFTTAERMQRIIERKANERYKRTCHKVPGKMGYQGRKVICSECGYGLGDSRWHFCPKCGAEICGAEVVDDC